VLLTLKFAASSYRSVCHFPVVNHLKMGYVFLDSLDSALEDVEIFAGILIHMVGFSFSSNESL
jgi:hypothetical protein